MAESETNNVNPEIDWNLKAAVIAIIGNRLSDANYYYSQKREAQAFQHYKGIRLMINPYLNEEEVKYFDDAEQILESYYGTYNTLIAIRDAQQKRIISFDSNDQKVLEPARRLLDLKKIMDYDLYVKSIMNCLKTYGFMPKQKEDRTKIN